ncbi:MAG: hypothetical protein KIT72_07510 [Polyangiaceae bacterium]|nr:hypothetical protein [Polyangiaceae bacterium]
MKIATRFEVPPDIAARLITGELVRRGGVIQYAGHTRNAGKVKAWLREASPGPSEPAELGGNVGRALGLIGSVPSILNLGATVGFGVATLHKLNKLNGKVDRLQSTVDIGFHLMVESLGALTQNQEQLGLKLEEKLYGQVLAKLRAAAGDMEDLAYDSPGRLERLVNILGRTSDVAEELISAAEAECQVLAESFNLCSSGRAKLDISTGDLEKMAKLRVAASAAAQRAYVLAELGQPSAAAKGLSAATRRLHSALLAVGKAIFQGQMVYDDLLNHFWPTVGVTPARVGMWADRFDPETGGLEGILRELQEMAAQAGPLDAGPGISRLLARIFERSSPGIEAMIKACETASSSGITPIDAHLVWSQGARENAPRFFDMLDGAWEDIDRLDGHVVEYDEMDRRKLRVSEYAQKLRVDLDGVPDGAEIVLMIAKDEDDLIERTEFEEARVYSTDK